MKFVPRATTIHLLHSILTKPPQNLLLPTCTMLAILMNMYPYNPHIITWSIDSTLDSRRDAMELVSQIIFDLDRHTLAFGGNAALVARLKIYPIP